MENNYLTMWGMKNERKRKTLKEIEMLCVGLLDARLKLRAMVRKEGVKD